MEFTWDPSFNSAADAENLVNETVFGDGYRQRSPSGINSQKLTLNLTFDTRTKEEANAIVSFLSLHRGSAGFEFNALPPFDYWQAPIHSTSTAYAQMSIVRNADSSLAYICTSSVVQNSGIAITNRSYWQPLCRLPMRFTCKTFSAIPVDFNNYTVTAVFEQVFDLL